MSKQDDKKAPQSTARTQTNWRKRICLALGIALSVVLVIGGLIVFLSPARRSHDPAILATIKVGMTRQEVELTLGETLVSQHGRTGIMVRSSQPGRSSTPGLIEEGGLDLHFDRQGILRKARNIYGTDISPCRALKRTRSRHVPAPLPRKLENCRHCGATLFLGASVSSPGGVSQSP